MMIESIQNHTNTEIDGLDNEENGFSFENSLSKTENLENNELPEGFKYDSEGYIVCEKNIFTEEDYEQEEKPIDKVLGGKMKEGDYLLIDYSDTNNDSLKKEIQKRTCGSTQILVEKTGGEFKRGNYYINIIIKEGMKIKIVGESDEYGWVLCQQNNDVNQNERDANAKAIEILLQHGVSENDLMELFGDNTQEDFIPEIIKNIANDLNIQHVEQENKVFLNIEQQKKIFGEYFNKIGNVSMLSGLLRYKLKQKLGDQFNEYIQIFTFKLNNVTEYFKDNDLVNYLLSPGCKITLNNIEEYVTILNNKNQGQGHWGLDVNLGIYTPQEAEEIFYYQWLNDLDLDDENTLKRIRDFRDNGITDEMILFAGTGVKQNLALQLHPHFVEELFINEKEGKNLFYFLSRYPQKLQNLGGKEIKEIDLNVNISDFFKYVNEHRIEGQQMILEDFTLYERNFCFRGILEMIKSRGDINVLPYPGEDADENELNKWKESWEKVIKEYENFLKSYIGLDYYTDQNGEKKEIDKKDTFDKIFYSMPAGKEDPGGAFDKRFGKIKEFTQEGNVLDYSNIEDENGHLDQSNGREMIEDICDYAPNHPNEKILVFIGTHGGENGESGNGWTKEDWLTISKYPNIKIMTTRCFFGRAYSSENNGSGDYIYEQQSQLSGFSNKTRGTSHVSDYFAEGFDKGLGFHELELYIRLQYGIESPLTENLEYTDRLTGKRKQSNIGLAYGEEGGAFENNA